jgi:hypothetical protein
MKRVFKRAFVVFLSTILLSASLSGCSSKKDKDGAQEAAKGFMDAIQSGSQEGINKYSSDEVATGEFVRLYDEDSLKEDLEAGLGDTNISEETQARLDAFCSRYGDMMEEYQITDVAIGDDGTATAYITVKNSFPFDVVSSKESQDKVSSVLTAYNEDNEEVLQNIIEEQGEDAAVEKASNDMLILILDTYEEEIASSEPVTYMLALTLNRNEELGDWYVSAVQSYDSSIAGTGAPATKTDTSATGD